MGGYRVQGRTADAAAELIEAAKALHTAGCFSIVLEGMPDVVAAAITETVAIPTVGIGAGPHCDGQVLVFHDLLGLGAGPTPKFVRQYANLAELATEAVGRFADDVRRGAFPADGESYHAPDEVRDLLDRTC
jgi:3-methyl-2-oxobutanoate hydroxymethyltransferase